MFASLVLAASAALAGGEQKAATDFGAVEWWNTIPLTLGRLKGRAVFVESFRTW
jgi:hypothetical protein